MIPANAVTEACRKMGRFRQKRPFLTETGRFVGRLRHLGAAISCGEEQPVSVPDAKKALLSGTPEWRESRFCVPDTN